MDASLKLAISNIAWPRDDDALAAELMCEHGIRGVELAPTICWDRPFEIPEHELMGYRRFWNRRGIDVVALQALLFGRPELTIFGEEAVRRRTLSHLRDMMRVASTLGAAVLVFGAPGNRRTDGRSKEEIDEIAVSFFSDAGAEAHKEGVVLCIEPNPLDYGCDFVTTSAEAITLVRRVASKGFGLHLDAAAMTMAGEPVAASLEGAVGELRHFHASEPFLKPLGSGGVDHHGLGKELRDHGYDNWVSIEMKRDAARDVEQSLVDAITVLEAAYGGS